MGQKIFTDESLKTLINETKTYVDESAEKKSDKAHTHNYAGSSSSGGAATSANKLNTNAGDSNTPVYFADGIPKVCTSLDLNTTGNAATATKLTDQTATVAELNYCKGVTSNIQTQLNGKADTSHSHSYLPLGGGTMSGRITFAPYGTDVLFKTDYGYAGLGTNSSGGGLFLYDTKTGVTGWNSSIKIFDKDGLNLVPKTGGTFSGDVSTTGNFKCSDRIKADGVYTTTGTSAANVVISNNYWMYRSTASSKRYKHDIRPLGAELNSEKLLNIPVHQYIYNLDYLGKDDQRYDIPVPGFIAEEVYEHYPIAVEITDGQVEDWNHRMIIPPMLDLVQKLWKRVDELEEKVKELEQ